MRGRHIKTKATKMDNKQDRGNHNSASNAKRTRLCPGHRGRTKWMQPAESTNADAEAGTAVHLAVETGDVSELNEQEATVAGMCDELSAALLYDVSPSLNGVMIQGEEEKEERYWYDFSNLKFSGQADWVVRWPEHQFVLIVDYKTGNLGADDASVNDQLKALLTCFMQENDPNIEKYERVMVAIIQPMCSPQMTSFEYSGRDVIIDAMQATEATFWTAEQKDGDISPGLDQCKYCEALGICPEAQSQVGTLALRSPTEIVRDPVKLGRLLDVGSLAVKIHELNREAAKTAIGNGEDVPGWKIQEQKGRAQINAEGVFAELSGRGFSAEALWKAATVSKSSIEKLLKIKTGETGKALKASIDGVLSGNSVAGAPIKKLLKA